MTPEARRAVGSSLFRRPVFWIAIAAAAALLAVAAFIVFRPSAAPTPIGTPSSSATPEVAPTPTRTPAAAVPGPFVTPGTASPSGDSKPARPAELEPVKPNDSVQGKDGMQIGLTRIESVQGEAVQPGEKAGPAVRVTVTITNGTDKQYSTNLVTVNAYTGKDRAPAETLVRPGGVPFYGRLEPGETTYGIYLFVIPADRRKDVTITVDYAAAQPIVVFRGDVG
jgi:hypothetical protein